ncbi:phosphate metabolism protein 7 [Rhodotorula toruloides]
MASPGSLSNDQQTSRKRPALIPILAGGLDGQQQTQTFITALVTGLIVLGAEVAAFIILKNRFRQIYSPRSYRVPPNKRVDPLPHSFLGWIPYVIRTPATTILQKNGLDAYIFVRFLFLMMEIFAPFMVVTWVILLPVDAAGSRGTNTGITRFTFGNVGLSQQPRYAAHLILVWILTFWVFYLIRREYAKFIQLRQDFLMSPEHTRLAQSKTVLVTGVPEELLNQSNMQRFCNVLPGGAKRIWFARDLKDLPDLYDRREKAVKKLEGAETKLLKLATKQIAKNEKKHLDAPASDPEASKSEVYRYVPQKKRPTHKLGPLGLWGKKVDSIEWAREEIETTNRELETERELLGGNEGSTKYPARSAVFIQFHTQIAAHMFAQCLAHHAPLRMSYRFLEVGQEDVIWGNLRIKPYEQRARYAASWAATLGLIILWSFPVAFVGLISNVSALCISAPWLAWLCKLPVPVNGIIQGALPPIALAVLFMLLPIILRLFARFEGIPLKTGIELSLMTRLFIFQVIHGFLIVTLASGLVKAIPAIAKNPSSAVTLLATQLPAASTFFLTYFVTTSFAGAAGSLLQIVKLIVYYVKLILLGSTPRSVFGIKYNSSTVAWGTLWPSMTLLTVIGLTYSVIAPLVCGFALVAFALFWFVYKYLFLLVIDTPPATETGGLFYPKALGHIFVGLYIEQICMCGLFFLAQDAKGKQSAIPEGAIMVVLIVITVLYHIVLNSGYQPLVKFLPLSVAPKIAATQGFPDGFPAHHNAGREAGQTSQLAPTQSETTTKEKDESTFPPPAGASFDEHKRPLRTVETNDDTGTLPGDEHLDQNAFDHPAMYKDYDTVWIPQDPQGLYRDELEASQAHGVDISAEGAYMNEKAKVDVHRAPPGEDWDDSQAI